jgi:hypothetical protein
VRVIAIIDQIELDNDDGYTVESVSATCSRCDHETQSYGTSDASVRRCLALLRDECPRGESNFYHGDDEC